MAKQKPTFAVTVGQAPAKVLAKRPYKTLTVRLPLDLHKAWTIHKATSTAPEDFQDFCIRKLREELGQE